MKKFYLLATLVLTATMGYAQQAVKAQKIDMKPFMSERMQQMKQATPADVAPRTKRATARRAAADGVWFARPEGTLVTTTTDEGSGYYVNSIVVPPYHDIVFKNMSDKKESTTWQLVGSNGVTDMTEYADENNDLQYGSLGFYEPQLDEEYGWYTPSYLQPQLTNGKITYVFGKENNNYYTGTRRSYLLCDSVGTYAYTDERTSEAGYAWGGLVAPNCDNYLFGTGTFTFKSGEVATSLGVVDFFPAPASPLYVERISLELYSATELLKKDAELTLSVYNAVEDKDGMLTVGDSLIAKLKCTVNDTTVWFSTGSQQTKTGMVTAYNAVFRNTVVDEIGSEYDEPFSIDCPFAVMVTGFDNPDVDGTFVCLDEAAEDITQQGVEAILADDNGVWSQTVYGGDPMVLPVRFYGCFDYIEAQEELYASDNEGNVTDTYSNLNVLRISADGKEVSNDGADEDHDFGAAVFYTNFPWFDYQDLENYYPLEIPEWVTAMSAFDGTNANDERTGMAFVSVECEPLPEGVTGRSAVIYFVGKGYQSKQPVILLQGDAKIDEAGVDAIANVKTTKHASGQMFNLAGQRVGQAAKGLVLQNGKKFFSK